MIINRTDMKKLVLIAWFMLCCLSMIAQTKFSGVVINQKFSDLVKQLNTKYTLVEPNYEDCKTKGYDTYVMHRYYVNFLGEDNAELIVYPNFNEKDAVERISIHTPYWCYTELKDDKCETSLRAYMQHLKSTYENKYGAAVVEVETNDYSTKIHNKWDLNDVIIDIILYEPNNHPANNVLHASMRISVEYIVKYKLIKNKGKDVSIDDI